jgi:hypothetical protein
MAVGIEQFLIRQRGALRVVDAHLATFASATVPFVDAVDRNRGNTANCGGSCGPASHPHRWGSAWRRSPAIHSPPGVKVPVAPVRDVTSTFPSSRTSYNAPLKACSRVRMANPFDVNLLITRFQIPAATIRAESPKIDQLINSELERSRSHAGPLRVSRELYVAVRRWLHQPQRRSSVAHQGVGVSKFASTIAAASSFSVAALITFGGVWLAPKSAGPDQSRPEDGCADSCRLIRIAAMASWSHEF